MADVYDELAEAINELYIQNFPAAKKLANLAMTRAQNRGYIKTIMGRRAHFTLYESRDYKQSNKDGYMTLEKAQERYGNNIRRAKTYKALNSLLQGSAADLMKKAMLDIWKAGLPVPLVQVHDELGFSLPRDSEGMELSEEITQVMIESTELKVPILVDGDWGRTWGDC